MVMRATAPQHKPSAFHVIPTVPRNSYCTPRGFSRSRFLRYASTPWHGVETMTYPAGRVAPIYGGAPEEKKLQIGEKFSFCISMRG